MTFAARTEIDGNATTGGSPLIPVAQPVSASVVENTSSNNIPLNITNATPTSVTVSTAASHGTATASGITIAYTPTANYTGPDSFDYTATNGNGTSPPALASITVTATPFSPVTHTYATPGTFTETVPTGANNVRITVDGAGGSMGVNDGIAAGGSGEAVWSGSVSGITSFSLVVGNITAGNGQDSTVTTSGISLVGGGGKFGSGATPGAGGTASGGNSANTSGSPGSGQNGGAAASGAPGGVAPGGPYSGSAPGGGSSAGVLISPNYSGANGGAGQIVFYYT